MSRLCRRRASRSSPARSTAGETKHRTRDIMEALGVADRADHLPAQLSGGQQQRVAIARSLIHEPSLLLAEEPTASLDKEMGRQVMQLFRSAAKERGAAVLVVTHDQRALDLVDRILEIEDGLLSVGAEAVVTSSNETRTG